MEYRMSVELNIFYLSFLVVKSYCQGHRVLEIELSDFFLKQMMTYLLPLRRHHHQSAPLMIWV